MQAQIIPVAAKAVNAGIAPDVRAISTVFAEFDIVDVGRGARFENEHEFMLRPVQGAHAAVVLGPDAEVLQVGIRGGAGGQHLLQMAPVHALKMNRAIDRIGREMAEYGLQESGEFGWRHFPGCHGEFAVLNRTEAADVPGDGHVVGGVGKHELGALLAK